MIVIVNGHYEKEERDFLLTLKDKVAILSSKDTQITFGNLNDFTTQAFDTPSLLQYFTSVFQTCLYDNISKITLITPQNDYFTTTHFQVLLGRSYLNVTKGALLLDIVLKIVQFGSNQTSKPIQVLSHFTIDYITTPLDRLDRLEKVQVKAEKRSLVIDKPNNPTKKSERPIQQSYLQCEPTFSEPTKYPEHSLGSLYLEQPERCMFGRVYGLNWDPPSPRKKQKV